MVQSLCGRTPSAVAGTGPEMMKKASRYLFMSTRVTSKPSGYARQQSIPNTVRLKHDVTKAIADQLVLSVMISKSQPYQIKAGGSIARKKSQKLPLDCYAGLPAGVIAR